jgi:glycoside/pentoside/hexuronide:cation symporter, GPH family
MTQPAASSRDMCLYGMLALPLAFAGLPLYVHLPVYYAQSHGVSLAALGGLMLALRLFDTVQDPLIGLWSDRARSRKRLMLYALPLLAAGMFALFNYGGGISPAWWLAGCLLVTFTTFSILQINLYAYGTEHYAAGATQTRLSAWREGFLFIGIMLASVLPYINSAGTPDYSLFGISALAVIIVVGGFSLLKGFSAQPPQRSHTTNAVLFSLLQRSDIRWVLGFYGMSALAAAIPATLYLFFVEDIIGAPEHGGWLLLAYFASGAAALPFWAACARRFGRRRVLYASISLMAGCFVWAFLLERGDLAAFYIITIATGSALGADMALPAAIYADTLKRHNTSASAGFGLWNFTTKLTLSLAAGISLPLLAWAGYDPAATNNSSHALFWLSASYALIPCALKIGALGILALSPIENETDKGEDYETAR